MAAREGEGGGRTAEMTCLRRQEDERGTMRRISDEERAWPVFYFNRTPRGYYLLNIRFVYDNTLSQHREEIKAGNESI